MSYCRWSSDDWRCDIYAYESVGDYWVIHVAGNRVVGDIPRSPVRPEPDANDETKQEWLNAYCVAHKAQMAFLSNCQREDINLPFAGESFDCSTLQDFKEKMLMLRGIGYNFPDHVLETIDEEITANE